MNHQLSITNHEKSLVLVDAMALVHRAFHAIPHLSKHGQPVNAAYGFTSTLLFVLKELNPKHIAVAYDEKGPTIRHEEFADYKATREETAEALKSQFPIVREIVTALGIPSFGVEGYEADDVIGTLATQATEQGVETIIVTGDHDLYQLINQSVRVYNVSRGTKVAELVDEDLFREKYGFEPTLMTDYKGLRGDTSDNIPGVPGVGPKTARKLVVEFGTLDNLYGALDCEKSKQGTVNSKQDEKSVHGSQLTVNNISRKLREKLCQATESAFMSKKLATIHLDVPVTLNLAATVVKDYDEERAKKLISHWGFKSLIPRLPSANPPAEQGSLFGS